MFSSAFGNRSWFVMREVALNVDLTTASDDEVLGHCGGLGAKPCDSKGLSRAQALQAHASPCKPLLQAPSSPCKRQLYKN